MATENYERVKGKTEHHSDVSLWFALLFLLGFGLVMIYSASSYTAFADYGDQMFYLKRQAVAVGLGLIAMIVVSRIPYHFWERFSVLGVLASAVLICLVKTPLGVESHGARRWIKTGIPGFNLQPAEVTKLAIILFLAVLVCKMGSAIRTWKGLIIMMAPPGVLFLMIWKITNNMSSALIVMAIAAIMVFVASPDYKKFVLLAILAIAAAIGLVMLIKYTDVLGSFRASRIRVWLDPESDPDDKGFQTLQALYAIGSGGVPGKGLAKACKSFPSCLSRRTT
jgi:cell division protein FtsW